MMRVAIVHDWMEVYAGAERVLEQLLLAFPDADLFSVADVLEPSQRGFLRGRPVKTSFIQKMPQARKRYRQYLPFMPLAVEQFDVSGYDLVLSSSHAVAKGVLTGPDQLHICYCYSPIRYAWDLQHRYLKESNLTAGLKGAIARAILHYLRLWDARTANGVDHFIGISQFISRRIWKVYRRDSVVIYPPVDLAGYPLSSLPRENFYLTASRMVPYKRIDLIVEAFSRTPERKLIVIGDGTDFEKIKAKAGPNVTLLGYQPNGVLRDHLQRARAFVFAAEEDFGIAPLEAQACGTPVIAYGKGGALETIIESKTGVFFRDQSVEGIHEALVRFEQMEFDPGVIRANAERFSMERFHRELLGFVHAQYAEFEQQRLGAVAVSSSEVSNTVESA
jgi:glycosyltransferase involved in cell wall biosynthesis